MSAPFWWDWPSWHVEAIAGLLLQTSLHVWGPGHAAWKYMAAGVAISVVYELWLDRHGWSWRDVLQRLPAQLAVEVVCWGMP